jgi:hypothetical protein
MAHMAMELRSPHHLGRVSDRPLSTFQHLLPGTVLHGVKVWPPGLC